MKSIFSDTIETLSRSFQIIEEDSKAKSALILMADNGHFDAEAINPLLQSFSKPVIGGVFPEIIVEGKRKKRGVLLIPLQFGLQTLLLDGNTEPADYISMLDENFGQHKGSHLFVFTDALGSNKNELIESLFNFFGLTVSYLGGGAGSLSFKPFPCILHNSGMHQNASVVALTDQKVSLGVAHGWTPICEPMKVTDAWDNQVRSINWAPAFEEYKKCVEAHAGKTLDPARFFDLAKSYPLGLVKLDDELIVRDPIMAEDSVLHIVDCVNQGEYITIMHGDMDSLLEAAAKARDIALAGHQNSSSIFVVDCISRVLFMEDDFQKELDVVTQNDHTLNGVLSIGEIANSGSSFLDIFNKTIVVATW